MLVLLDLTLAFDTLETNTILPAKLEHYGADKKTIQFFKKYYTGRKSIVQWNGTNSKVTNLHDHGCVQGSVLGPTIYNHYTQDIETKLKKSKLIKFADDNNMVLASRNIKDLIKMTNEELDILAEYTEANSLIINIEKSNYMIFKPKKGIKQDTTDKITIKGKEITRVSSQRYLGIIIDDKLNFKKQAEKLIKKLREATNALRCCRYALNFKAKRTLYFSLFNSHLEYGAYCYQDKLNKIQWQKITKLQKKCIRILFNAKNRTHTGKLFKLADITPADRTFEKEE